MFNRISQKLRHHRSGGSNGQRDKSFAYGKMQKPEDESLLSGDFDDAQGDQDFSATTTTGAAAGGGGGGGAAETGAEAGGRAEDGDGEDQTRKNDSEKHNQEQQGEEEEQQGEDDRTPSFSFAESVFPLSSTTEVQNSPAANQWSNAKEEEKEEESGSGDRTNSSGTINWGPSMSSAREQEEGVIDIGPAVLKDFEDTEGDIPGEFGEYFKSLSGDNYRREQYPKRDYLDYGNCGIFSVYQEEATTTTTGQQQCEQQQKRRLHQLWVATICTSISAVAIFLLVVSPLHHPHFRVFSLREDGAEEEGEPWPELRVGVRSVIAAILVALAASISSAAGLGGGLLFIPILNLLLQFDPKTATGVANFWILGSSSAGVALNLIRDHPQKMNKPMVDFDIAVLLLPMMLVGNSIGVFLNTIVPDWLLTLLVTTLLIYLAVHTTRTGRKQWREETRIANARRVGRRSSLRRAETATEKALSESLKGFYKAISSRYPIKTISVLTFTWLSIFALQLLRGNHGNQGVLEVQKCGTAYWLLTVSQVPIALGVTALVIWKRSNTPPTSELEPGSSDVQVPSSFVLGPQKSALFSGMALVAGVVAGMFGLGGAIIINPLLLSEGVLPQVTTATSLLLMFYSSFMSAIQYYLLGRIPLGYSLIGALIAAMASAAGVLVVRKVVTKFKRPSLIVFVIASTIGVSSIIMASSGAVDAWKKYRSGSYMGFSTPCQYGL